MHMKELLFFLSITKDDLLIYKKNLSKEKKGKKNVNKENTFDFSSIC